MTAFDETFVTFSAENTTLKLARAVSGVKCGSYAGNGHLLIGGGGVEDMVKRGRYNMRGKTKPYLSVYGTQ